MSDALGRLTGALADRYTIERELGAGGMATVYLAEDLKHDRKVAIKVLRPELGAVIGADRFLKEIKTTANLQHPHILGLIDSGDAGGLLWYAMPFVEGESLRDRLQREKQLPIPDAVRIATEVAGALDYAHRHGVIHRDIKPENILLHDGSALVADFGIALAASTAGTRMTETGMSLGTPQYMSPEQAMGEREITARSDVYALGCITYEMLTGDPPFTGSTAQAIVAKVVTEKPHSLTSQRHTIPPHLEAAVLTALEKLPADRFATAAEFATALSDRSYATTAMASAAGNRKWQWIAGALGLGLVAVAMVAVLGWTRKGGPDGGAGAALAYQIHLTPSESDVGFVAAQLALSDDGGVIVYSDTVGGTRQLWVKERGVAEARPIPGTRDGQSPFLSPDAKTVAYTVGSQLMRIPVTGGAPVVLSDSAAVEGPVHGAWMTDGTIVFFGGVSSFLYAVPDTGGVTRRIATADQLLGVGVVIAAVPDRPAVVVTVCDAASCTNPIVNLVHLNPLTIQRLLPGSTGAWPLRRNRLLNVLPDGSVFLADFDPATGRVGEGSPLFGGVTVAGLGPELAVGVNGVTLQATGGAGAFSNLTHLVVAGLDGSTQVVDSSWTGIFSGNSRVELSPDGRRVLFSTIDQDGVKVSLITKPFPNGSATRFSSLGIQNSRASWSPDGKRIAWLVVDERGQAAVYHQSADGTGKPTLLASDPRGIYDLDFSPDGAWLLYRTDDVAAGRGDIYARPTSGDTTSIAVAASDLEETSPAVSPDGHWVAYAARIGVGKEIIVRPFPNVDGGRIQVSSGGGTEPLWSRDGRTLYYRNVGRGQILAARMTPDGGFPSDGRSIVHQSALHELWDNDDTRQYSLMPDGKGFLMMQRIRATGDSTATHLILREHIVPIK